MNATAFDALTISGVTCDSRRVRPGYLFAAIAGTQTDGRRFIPAALDRGAAAILAPPGTEMEPPDATVALLVHDNPRRQYALMAARFFARQPTTIAAVTGTNGKTSVVSFLRQIWSAAGYRAASAGTLGAEIGGFADAVVPELRHAINLTTPDPADLHRSLAEMADVGIDYLGLEASSHGLQQFRLDGVRVAAAAFTNLSRDHLDYHGDEQTYFAAKSRLFAEIVMDRGTVVINADIAQASALRTIANDRGLRVIDYGFDASDLVIRGHAADGAGQTLDLALFGQRHRVRLPLPGAFQASNALAAAGLALACGMAIDETVAALAGLKGVRGRLELVGRHPNGAAIYVDYAHTPDALDSVLGTLRPHTAGDLHVVFGCGGDRDPGKRARMGRAASRAADHVIVTDDNPRTEAPALIRRAVLAGCPQAREIGNRAQAIETVIGDLQPGDILVVAGKGHESAQIIGNEVMPFDDADVVRQALRGVTP